MADEPDDHWAGRFAPLVMAQLVIAGLAVAAVPQHATSIARVALAAIGASMAVVLVRRLRGEAEEPWSPFERPGGPPRRREEPPGLSSIRSSMTSDQLVRADVWPLTPGIQQRARAVAAMVADQRGGVDLDDEAQRPAATRALSPEVVAAVTAGRPRSSSPDVPMRRPRPGEVAEVVHAVLDRLDVVPPLPFRPPRSI
ncbi:MAG: hypothetical protein WKF93_08150 [Acidimicrobiales bacterium]